MHSQLPRFLLVIVFTALHLCMAVLATSEISYKNSQTNVKIPYLESGNINVPAVAKQ